MSLGGSGVSIGGVRILRVGYFGGPSKHQNKFDPFNMGILMIPETKLGFA